MRQPIEISFRKQPGDPALGIAFFWTVRLHARSPGRLCERLIPELYYDYVYAQAGRMAWVDAARTGEIAAGGQALRTLFARPVMLRYHTPLALFGARLRLRFAEWFWEPEMPANAFAAQAWVRRKPKNLGDFASQVTAHLQAHRRRKTPYPLLADGLTESGWLASYSPRHKRRLYQSVFGISRQALEGIEGLHAFLAQACDFGAGRPRIIGHVNPDVFYDQPHLNHTFKRLTGLSPLAYFEASTLLQDNLMAASYNAGGGEPG